MADFGCIRNGMFRLACLLPLFGSPLIAQQGVPDAPAPKPDVQSQFPADAPAAPKNDHSDRPPEASATQEGQVPAGDVLSSDLAQFGKFVVNVNAVQVPVTVKDSSGRLMPGLRSTDFTVLEDGVPQRLSYFTTDPFPLSAAVVINTDLPAGTMKKVNETLPALIGAFADFDEVALYRYGHTVSQVTGFSGAASISPAMLARVKRPGRQGGPPAVFGPMAQGPTMNGHPVNDPNAQTATGTGVSLQTARESYVLNDAILRAAQDLGRRDRARRRIIFVISDGRELGSRASFNEVKRVLLSNNIAVFALGVDTAALPIYDKLNRYRLPGFGYGNLLASYANATGGNTFTSIDRQSIEESYARVTEFARNQYTLGYSAKATASSAYRAIEVRVHHYGPKLTVIAKTGYYPLPPQSAPR